VHGYDAAPVEAVLEVYSDVTELVARMQRSQWTILAAVLGAMALVYLAIQLILARYKRLLREQEGVRGRAGGAHPPPGVPRLAHRPAESACASASSSRRRCVRAKRDRRAARAAVPRPGSVQARERQPGPRRRRRAAAPRRRAHPARGARSRHAVPHGGDEFTVLLEDVRGPEEAAMVAAACWRGSPSRCSSASISSRSPRASASRSNPSDEAVGERPDQGRRHRHVPRQGARPQRYAFFAPELNQRLRARSSAEAALRRAASYPAARGKLGQGAIQPGESLRQRTR
jgi:hypothetical protein